MSASASFCRTRCAARFGTTTLTAASADGIPGRARSELQTAVNLELGQSIALAGLFSDGKDRARNGLPLLSKIPVLGYLFGTRSERGLLFDGPGVCTLDLASIPFTGSGRELWPVDPDPANPIAIWDPDASD